MSITQIPSFADDLNLRIFLIPTNHIGSARGNKMSTHSIPIDEQLYIQALTIGKVEARTAPQQVEHWAKIGKSVEDNPDLTYSLIKSIFEAEAEIKAVGGIEALEQYEFG